MDMQSTSILVRKFSTLGPLTDAERALLEGFAVHVREIGRDRDLVREGDRPTHCILLLSGFASRYRTLADGRRQIVSFHIPGDFLICRAFCWRGSTTASPCSRPRGSQSSPTPLSPR